MVDRRAERRITQDVQDWNRWRRESQETEAPDLRSASLDRLRLVGADLREVHLEGATLKGTDLTGANLEGAHLSGTDLLDAVLKRVNLAGATWDETTRWPENFHPPAPVDVVREKVLTDIQRERLLRSIEPLLTVADRLIAAADPGDLGARSLEHRVGQVRREAYENVDEPDPLLLEGNLRDLLRLVAQRLPTDELTMRAEEAGADSDAIRRFVGAVGEPLQQDAKQAARAAVEAAQHLVPLIDARGPAAALEKAFVVVGWSVAGAGAGLGFESLFSFAPPGWLAAAGAAVGILANFYRGASGEGGGGS